MKIAIIGAGPAGLCVAKELIESDKGHQITIYEANDKVGGVFAKSYKGLHLVNNPLLISFSDFIDDFDNSKLEMWSAEQYVDYLERYAKHYNVYDHIKFSHKVVKVEKNSQGWKLIVENHVGKNEHQFDYVVVCSGVHQKANKPFIPNESRFSGQVIMGSDVKDYDFFKDKRVLLMGMGEYASDLSFFIAKHAKELVVSIRRWPGYFIPRYQDGMPTDIDSSRSYFKLPKDLHHTAIGKLLVMKRYIEFKSIKDSYDKQIYSVFKKFNSHPKEVGIFERFSTKSENFARAIIDYGAQIKPKMLNIKNNTVFFEDGTKFECDYIIPCIGYTVSVPFLDEALQEEMRNIRRLYKYMIPFSSDNIAFIGFVRPGIGSIPPMAELQARYLTLLINKKLSLPNRNKMMSEVKKQEIRDLKQFPIDAFRLTSLTDYLTFLTDMARTIKCDPSSEKLFTLTPVIWYRINYATICPVQFRLFGPGAKPEMAKEVIRKLPLKPKSSIAVESILAVICRFLSLCGLRRYKLITQRK